uniref:NAC domain-containing protein n=1 Tax=Tanacetum cinerariifolium TaxID=118510 RepID=A0A6L2NP11_TANCI|nr:NAC domain-containing protein [Tanacetum cinerariifolium]
MEPLDALLIGNEVVSTTPVKENDKFIKFSVDDLVPNLRESVVTFVCDLECGMPFDSPHLPRTNVLGDAKVEIDLLFGEQVDTLLMGDREIDFNSFKDVGNLGSSLVDDPVPIPRMFDKPLGNSNSMSRSFETSDFLLEDLTAEIGLDNSILKKLMMGITIRMVTFYIWSIA